MARAPELELTVGPDQVLQAWPVLRRSKYVGSRLCCAGVPGPQPSNPAPRPAGALALPTWPPPPSPAAGGGAPRLRERLQELLHVEDADLGRPVNRAEWRAWSGTLRRTWRLPGLPVRGDLPRGWRLVAGLDRVLRLERLPVLEVAILAVMAGALLC